MTTEFEAVLMPDDGFITSTHYSGDHLLRNNTGQAIRVKVTVSVVEVLEDDKALDKAIDEVDRNIGDKAPAIEK